MIGVHYLGNVLLAHHVLSRFDVLHPTNQMRDGMLLALNAIMEKLCTVHIVRASAYMCVQLHGKQNKFHGEKQDP